MVVGSVERTSKPARPIIAVKSAYSIKSCPPSSAITAATVLANCAAIRMSLSCGSSLHLRSDPIDRAVDEGGTPPSSDGLPCLRGRQGGVEVGEVPGDLRPDGGDRGDRANGDDPHEQAVLDQVLAGILTNETIEQVLHVSDSCD